MDLTPTPIPGAAWLLGSGLVGLVALKRRNDNEGVTMKAGCENGRQGFGCSRHCSSVAVFASLLRQPRTLLPSRSSQILGMTRNSLRSMPAWTSNTLRTRRDRPAIHLGWTFMEMQVPPPRSRMSITFSSKSIPARHISWGSITTFSVLKSDGVVVDTPTGHSADHLYWTISTTEAITSFWARTEKDFADQRAGGCRRRSHPRRRVAARFRTGRPDRAAETGRQESAVKNRSLISLQAASRSSGCRFLFLAQAREPSRRSIAYWH